ncbi:MAG: hypothetical protein DMG64_15790 [Acidobacteria bacterium]|nr:MAG: hypothetical protein DMG64_15790 [Acidobacteriota bacterium]
MFRFHSCVGVLAAMLIFSKIVVGQASLTITGVIEDGSGATIAGAKVSLIRQDTNEIKKSTSGEDGTFSLNDVSQGDYVLKVEMKGFEAYQKSVSVGSQTWKPLKITLKIEAAKEQVNVNADSADELSTSDSDAATTRGALHHHRWSRRELDRSAGLGDQKN